VTLARPVYKITLTNVTQGWTRTVTAGDEVDPEADDYLLDGLKVSWGIPENAYPGPLEPDEFSFGLFARTAALMPKVGRGDIFTVSLVRPKVPTDVVYVETGGRARLISLVQLPGKGVFVYVTVSDFMADAASNTITYPTALPYQDFAINRLTDLARRAGFNLRDTLGGDSWPAGYPATVLQGKSVAEALNEVAYSWHLQGRRVRWDWLPYQGPGLDPLIIFDPDSPIYYYLSTNWATDTSIAPYALQRVGGITSAIMVANPYVNTQTITLDAAKLQLPAERSQDAPSSPNRVEIEHPTTAGDGSTVIERYEYPALVQSQGPIVRSITAQDAKDTATTWDATVPGQGSQYLPKPQYAAGGWSFPDLTIELGDRMGYTDAEVDLYAHMFYPHKRESSPIGRPLVILNIDEETNVDGLGAIGNLIGASFQASDGRMTISPRVKPWNTDTVIGAGRPITWEELAALPLIAPTTWNTIDPDLTWNDFRLIGN